MTVSRNLRARTKGLLAVGLAAVAMAAAVAPAAAQDPVSGGTLTMARTADIFTFDPYNTQDDYSIFTELQVYDRLVKLAADGKSVEPELAESWEIAPDGLSATFKLRPGVLFSDGTPLTADDVVFSLTRAIDQTGSWGFLFSPVTGVEKVDESTIKLTMSEPFAPLELALSTFAASIYSKANFEKYGDTAGEHPLGTGAFMLDRWDKGSQVVLVKNPNYWQAGKPYLDGVTFTIVGDDNARVLQLQGGQVDAIDFVPPNQIDPLVASGAQLQKVDGTAVGWLTLNEAIKPLDEANVRCALAYAVDRDAIAKNVYFPSRQCSPQCFEHGRTGRTPDSYPLSLCCFSGRSAPRGKGPVTVMGPARHGLGHACSHGRHDVAQAHQAGMMAPDARVVHLLLPHASSKTTTEIHSHVTAAQERQAAEVLEAALAR